MKLARRLLASRPLSKYYDREEFPAPTCSPTTSF